VRVDQLQGRVEDPLARQRAPWCASISHHVPRIASTV
jgi:hypothetical protein